MMTNREFSEKDKVFRDSCREADIPATQRQASKWHMKRGLAYMVGRPIVISKEKEKVNMEK